MDITAAVDGPIQQTSQASASGNASSDFSPIVSSAAAATRHNPVATAMRISTRAPTPYPDIVDTPSNGDTSPPPLQLAEVAANASMQLQQQLTLMAQAIGLAPSTVSSASFPLLTQQTVANSANGSPNSGLSNMLDQYISAAIQQQQLGPFNHQTSASPSSVSNFSAPLAAYLQAASSQSASTAQTSPVSAIQLLQHQNSNANLTHHSNGGLPNLYSSLLSAAAAFCPCGTSPMNTAITTSVPCPYHSHTQSDGNNNSQNNANDQQHLAEIGLQQQAASLLLNPSHSQSDAHNQQHLRPTGSILNHQTPVNVATFAAAVHSHRMARSSLKRSNAASATANSTSALPESTGEVAMAVAAAAAHVSSPPPMLVAPNSTSVRLSSGLGYHNDGGGPSRGPKLRRLASFDEVITEDEIVQPSLSGQIASAEISEFRAPSIASASATNTAATAIVQLQQQAVAAAAAALPPSATILSLTASSVVPTAPSTTTQQQQRLLSHQRQSTTPASVLATPSFGPSSGEQTNPATLATVLGPAASISAGVEHIVAAALNAASAVNAVLSPQTIGAMAAASGFTQPNTGQCAVCAAAACQSRMGASLAAAAVTACSCLHHEHHHLHCHHNTTMMPPALLPPVCTLCNSNVASGGGAGSTASSPPMTNISHQSHRQSQHSSNAAQFHQANTNCVSASNGVSASVIANSTPASIRLGASSHQPVAQIAPIAQRYLTMNPSVLMGAGSAGENIGAGVANNVGASVNLQANASGIGVGSSAAAAAATALSPSAVTAMLLNSAAAMSQQQNFSPQFVQPSSSLYSFQRNATALGDLAASNQQNMNSMHQNLLANRLAHQERERDAVNHFYHQQQQQRVALNAAAVAAAASQQHHLMRPLIMVPRLPSQMDLANVLLLHHPGSVGDAATLVLNGGANAASALAHAANPHHIVANAMATATAPEPQPVGVSLDQIKKHSQKLAYVKDPDVPEQERERCTVCLSDFETGDELRALNCAHLFHTECIDRWLQYNKKCPVCRVDMDKGGAGSSTSAAEAAAMLNVYAAAAAAASAASSTTTC